MKLLLGVTLLSFLASMMIITAYLKSAVSEKYLQQPNFRSMHQKPTPTSGGIGIIIPFFVLLVWLMIQTDFSFYWAATGMFIIALLSLLDDYRDIAIKNRLYFQILATICLIIQFKDQLNQIYLFTYLIPAIVVVIFIFLATLWLTNLYNFMDGMDGFSASMTISTAVVFAIFGHWSNATSFLLINACLAATTFSFLCFNWPPAKVFMGDIGAVTIGYIFAFLIVWGVIDGIFTLWVAAIVLLPFWLDATYTLARRMLRKEKFWQSHKQHFYQRLVHGGIHKKKVLVFEQGLMLLCAVTAMIVSFYSEFIQFSSLLILIVLSLLLFLVLVRNAEMNLRR